MADKSTGKKGWRPDNRPARKRYWNRRTLEERKVKAMMKAYGLTRAKAKIRWHAERKTRMPDGFVKDYTEGDANTHNKKKKVA